MIAQIENLPDVSFIEDTTLEDVEARMKADYEEKYEEITGNPLTLRRADPETLKLYACAVQIYQLYLHIDYSGKMNLLKYSFSDFLDNLAATKAGIERLPAAPAVCTVRFTLAAASQSVTTIPKGTRVSNGDALYFATNETTEIKAGDTTADIPCTCQTAGIIGNSLAIGDLNTLVDILPYIKSVSNIDVTTGGTDVEDDESFTDRIYLSPSRYSTAGPENAYIYHTMSADANIGDVHVASPEPGDVHVYFLTADGDLPDDELIKKVKEHLDDRSIRPLTDKLEVMKPKEQTFDISVKYYVTQANKDSALTIQAAVDTAIANYITWQTSSIGRDINPSVLTHMVVDAGAKRVEVTSPEFTKVEDDTVARIGQKTVTYEGIEDD